MGKERLEAFSDGVIAIIITIMVLELKAPAGTGLADLKPLAPGFLGYGLSFVFVGIYWNNHHHLLRAVRTVTGGVLWANLHLLFWLSVTPFTTAWMGEHPLAPAPTALYGAVLLMDSVAFTVMARLLVRHEGPDSTLAKALGEDRKSRVSLALYAIAVGAAYWAPVVSLALYVTVALMWILPDRRIERAMDVG